MLNPYPEYKLLKIHRKTCECKNKTNLWTLTYVQWCTIIPQNNFEQFNKKITI